jgi:D-alanyl-D-alanine carboxypeptidase
LRKYPGTIGVKTGDPTRSGRCLVSCAERDGVTLVAATLNCRDDWNGHMALLDSGFARMKRRRLFSVSPKISAYVVGGTAGGVDCAYRADLEAGLSDEEMPKVEMKLLMRRFYYAPVTEGQKLGAIEFRLGDVVLGRTDVVAAGSVAREKPDRFKDFLLSIF